ncbi:MAG TPA: GGDEF domain-containing protein [Solirubrobacterales bacterium]
MAARTPRGDGPAGDAGVRQLAQEVSSLQAELLAKLHREMGGGASGEAFAQAAQELAKAFGSVSATAIGALASRREGEREQVPGLHRSAQMRRRLEQLVETHRRYDHPFALLVIDVEGPGAREGDAEGGRDTVLAIVGAALRDSVRLVDETFRLEESGLCVLAPNQTTVGGVQMAERLLGLLDELEAAGGLPIGISAGVVACPEHGTDAEALLREADEAMWRAQAVGQPVGVGALRSVQDR